MTFCFDLGAALAELGNEVDSPPTVPIPPTVLSVTRATYSEAQIDQAVRDDGWVAFEAMHDLPNQEARR